LPAIVKESQNNETASTYAESHHKYARMMFTHDMRNAVDEKGKCGLEDSHTDFGQYESTPINRTLSRICAPTPTYIHTYMHTNIYTYLHTYILADAPYAGYYESASHG
jgi:hypothetical protein